MRIKRVLRGAFPLGVGQALAAASLFGASVPLAKMVLADASPFAIAGWLYLGSGVGLALWWAFMRKRAREATLTRRDWPWLAGAIACGGVAAPVLLMWGLARVPAASASLLLNLEGVLTTLLAWFAFKENFDRRIALGVALITAGAVLLSWRGAPAADATTGATLGATLGALAIAGACLAWALDNNLTRKIAGADPVQIAGLKGLVAGATNLGLAGALGAQFPSAGAAVTAALIGFGGYGVSLVLFVLALRHIGTARTSAYFGIAPFAGAGIALLLLGEAVGAGFWPAAALMAAGLWLHLSERHAHFHRHEPQTHAHRHVHDSHHQHTHDFDWDGREPHTHPHTHAPVAHTHAHFPDLHHRHRHRTRE